VVTEPPTFPDELTVTPAPFGGAPEPPAGAPVVALGVDALLPPGVNVPPAVPELDPVFTPVLSEPLFVGAALMLTRRPGFRCACATDTTLPSVNAAAAATRIV